MSSWSRVIRWCVRRMPTRASLTLWLIVGLVALGITLVVADTIHRVEVGWNRYQASVAAESRKGD